MDGLERFRTINVLIHSPYGGLNFIVKPAYARTSNNVQKRTVNNATGLVSSLKRQKVSQCTSPRTQCLISLRLQGPVLSGEFITVHYVLKFAKNGIDEKFQSISFPFPSLILSLLIISQSEWIF